MRSLCSKKQTSNGFTIVELAVVIVVISILALISVATYTGIQEKAKNAAIKVSARQVIDAINLYIVMNGEYPSTGSSPQCLVPASSGCTYTNSTQLSAGDATTKLNTITQLPASIPAARGYGDTHQGVVYQYSSARTLNPGGVSRPAIVVYSLLGNGQRCDMSNITNTYSTSMQLSTTGYSGNVGNSTRCVVSIDGPAH